MKNFKILFYLFFVLACSIACEAENVVETPKSEVAQDAHTMAAEGLVTMDINENIFVESEEGDLFPTEEEIRTVLIEQLRVAGVTADYSEIKIVVEPTEEGDITVLRAKDYENGVDTAVPLHRRGDGLFLIRANAGTCSCKSKACATSWGCNASTMGGNCLCSSCSGDCEKTSTAVFASHLIEHISGG